MAKEAVLVRISKIMFVFFGLMLGAMAILFFLSGTQSYMDGERTEAALGNIVLSVALVSFPLAILFGYKAAIKYLVPQQPYQLPDSPAKTMLYIVLTAGFVLTTAISIIVFLFYLNA